MKPKTKFLNKILGVLLVFATLISTFFTFSILVQASSLALLHWRTSLFRLHPDTKYLRLKNRW